MAGLPNNWELEDGKMRWTPKGARNSAPAEQPKVLAKRLTQQYDSQMDPGDMSSHLLTLPSLTKWRKYWTENDELSCGGWFLRHVSGFVNDD